MGKLVSIIDVCFITLAEDEDFTNCYLTNHKPLLFIFQNCFMPYGSNYTCTVQLTCNFTSESECETLALKLRACDILHACMNTSACVYSSGQKNSRSVEVQRALDACTVAVCAQCKQRSFYRWYGVRLHVPLRSP